MGIDLIGRRRRLTFAACLALVASSLSLRSLAQDAAPERLAADAPRTTTRGATFIAPAGWSIVVRGPATILESPEGDSRIALVDVDAADAADADAAVAAAWSAYRPDAPWKLKVATGAPDEDGWRNGRTYSYETSPNERRDVGALARQSAGTWTVAITDFYQPTAEKRLAQIALIFSRLFPKGYHRETFAGRTANILDRKRIAALKQFIERGQRELEIPGVALGLLQNGRVVFTGGFGVRALGRPEKVDADTLFAIASNTKAMTTLLLAKLVDEGRLDWEAPVTRVMPSFKLGDAETTAQVRVKHLICACTGLPRQDYEWLFEFNGQTPASAFERLSDLQPTSKFGELFQYSNVLAAGAGYVAAHVAFPDLALGAGYDRAMQERVFDPLVMKATTFDFTRALGRNHASAHALDIDGRAAPAVMDVNYSIVPVRPAGGAWSNVHDVLRYVQMELSRGLGPGGARYIGEGPLLARRAPQVSIGTDITYGMGLIVDSTWGIPVVSHGGSLIGYKTDLFFLPDHGVGAVVLTNSDTGQVLTNAFNRKLLEVLFDGESQADATLHAETVRLRDQIAGERKTVTAPPPADQARLLAARYRNAALGDIAVSGTPGVATVFDFGEWKTPMGSRRNPDGTTSFVTIGPGIAFLEFVVGGSAGGRTLTVRDAQHEYVFAER
jgi:CubicO group peptidase (beta-lactamase class C family)